MAEVYTDPAAQAAVLGIGDSPENRQIAEEILKKGPDAVLQEARIRNSTYGASLRMDEEK